MTTTSTFATGLEFPECPRWHDGALWLSDMWTGRVLRYDAEGTATTVWQAPREPITGPEGDEALEEVGGLGWLPDGRLLVVGMVGRRLYRLDPDGPVVVADLSPLSPGMSNDMAVGADGTAYISQIGFDLHRWGSSPVASPLMRVAPDGTLSVAADGLMVPNGVAITADGRTLVVAESFGGRLSRFAVADDGSLGEREDFARLRPGGGERHPMADGLCLDEEGAAWWADPRAQRVVRVLPGGEPTHELPIDGHPLAVVLGGRDRRTLYVCVAATLSRNDRTEEPPGRVLACPAEVPGAGTP